MNELKSGYTLFVFSYNEQEVIKQTLVECIEVMNALNLPSEIIFVDDGSTDSTSLIAKEFLKKNKVDYQIYRHTKNLGPSSALITASKKVHYTRFIIIPGDLTYDAKNITKVVELDIKQQNNSKLTLGIKTKSKISRGIIRNIASKLATLSLIWTKPSKGFLPNYGLIICPSWILQLIPQNLKPYGQAIGLLGTALILNCSYATIEVEQIEGSQFRSSKLNINKVLDVLHTHFTLMICYRRIKHYKTS